MILLQRHIDQWLEWRTQIKVHNYLHTPDKEPMTNQSNDITKAQLKEPMSSVGVSCRIIGEVFLIRTEMTQTQLHPPKHMPALLSGSS